MENQLLILKESLEKKIQVLADIQKYNKKQEEAFMGDTVDLDGFDAAIEEKGKLVERVTRLDDGFELLYGRLSEQLKGNKEKYTFEIRELQELIRKVTEMSVAIQAQEKRNKQLVEKFFSKERMSIGQNRKASKAAYDYYKKVSNTNFASSQYYDSKQ